MLFKTACVLLGIASIAMTLHAQKAVGYKKGKVYVSGENPGIRLLMKEGGQPATSVSFWRVVYSLHGAGHICYVTSDITGNGPSNDDVRTAFTDNEKLADFIGKDIMTVFDKVYVEKPFTKTKATFQSSGDTMKEWKETIKSDKHTIELIWRDFGEAFQLDTPVGGRFVYGVTSMLLPAKSADVVVNGVKAVGRIYPSKYEDIPNTTASLAFSETWVK